jgi:hypothetical protein
VTVCSGERISPIDLHHENLPDPVLDMFHTLERRLDRLEEKAAEGDETAAGEKGGGQEE